jgi:hypothetical protein
MSLEQSHTRITDGFHPTARHLIILLIYIVLLFGEIIPFLSRIGQTGTRGVLTATLLLSPPLLALLVVFIDRAGPLRNWAVLFLFVLLYPSLALYHDVVVVIDYVADGRLPTLWATLLLNATLLPVSVMYGRKMVPRPCPGCRRRTLIPLMRLFKKDKRSSNTCWCASCGGKFWKDRGGNWCVERRKTWLDAQKEPPTRREIETGSESHTEPDGPMGRRLSPGETNEIRPS